MKKLGMVLAVLFIVAGASNAEAAVGVSLEYDGSFYPGIGINFTPNTWVVDVLGRFYSVDGGGTEFGGAVRVDKLMDPTAPATGLWGLSADVLITSPDVGDSWTDFSLGGHIGASGHINDHFHIVGHAGVKVYLFGAAQFVDDDSRTDFGTYANLMFRWTGVFGGE